LYAPKNATWFDSKYSLMSALCLVRISRKLAAASEAISNEAC
jgi:hypothetical protein